MPGSSASLGRDSFESRLDLSCGSSPDALHTHRLPLDWRSIIHNRRALSWPEARLINLFPLVFRLFHLFANRLQANKQLADLETHRTCWFNRLLNGLPIGTASWVPTISIGLFSSPFDCPFSFLLSSLYRSPFSFPLRLSGLSIWNFPFEIFYLKLFIWELLFETLHLRSSI